MTDKRKILFQIQWKAREAGFYFRFLFPANSGQLPQHKAKTTVHTLAFSVLLTESMRHLGLRSRSLTGSIPGVQSQGLGANQSTHPQDQ
jgi:hypothetical protein